MSNHISQKLWKRSCGLSRWFLYESIPSSDLDISQYPESLPSNAPVQKLPVELLGEIFLWTLSDWGPMTDERSALVLQPLIISHVCGHWRSVSLSIPMLWATIWIDRPRAAHLSMVQLWIQRSRTCPLSINLRQTDPKSCLSFPTPTEHDITDDIFLLLLPHLRRWQTIDFIFKTGTQLSLDSLPGDEVVALEHVALHIDSWDTTSAESLQSALYSRPSVRSIHLMPASKQCDVPWKQLTYLEVDAECTLETCLSILASCPELSGAKFTSSAQPDWSHTPFTHPEQYLTLPSLVDLSIKASRIDLAPFFDRLTLPALRSLALEYCHVPRAMPDHSSLHSLLERSSCVLETFSLHETARVCDDQRHIAFLQSPHMTSLMDLELKVDMTDKVVKFFTLGGEGAPPLPNLTDIALKDCRGDHISDEVLACMLSSRIAPGQPNMVPLRFAELQLRLASHGNLVLPVDEGRTDNLELRFELLNCVCHCS
ncbi:hypothetical protein B0H19DRAFT_66707 [Mycena capillaripes]|nr:hypothetical protein B0H19DRAFT_66707 [Mycena capillaripes]